MVKPSLTSELIGAGEELLRSLDREGRYAIEEGGYVVLEARDDGILIRPAAVLPIETYPAERRAEFLLTNAVDGEDYERAVDEVRQMGLDPEAVPHRAPADDA